MDENVLIQLQTSLTLSDISRTLLIMPSQVKVLKILAKKMLIKQVQEVKANMNLHSELLETAHSQLAHFRVTVLHRKTTLRNQLASFNYLISKIVLKL